MHGRTLSRQHPSMHIACVPRSVTTSLSNVLQGISQGMQPPPPLVTALTTLCCIGLVVWTFISQGKSTAALAIAALLVLSLQLLASEKPRFAQLTSSVFGLFYCGECLLPPDSMEVADAAFAVRSQGGWESPSQGYVHLQAICPAIGLSCGCCGPQQSTAPLRNTTL